MSVAMSFCLFAQQPSEGNVFNEETGTRPGKEDHANTRRSKPGWPSATTLIATEVITLDSDTNMSER